VVDASHYGVEAKNVLRNRQHISTNHNEIRLENVAGDATIENGHGRIRATGICWVTSQPATGMGEPKFALKADQSLWIRAMARSGSKWLEPILHRLRPRHRTLRLMLFYPLR
jgi:hypothetical protein